jgi:hypothetical protein
MSKAQSVILAALATVPAGRWQRIDGLRCEPRVIDLGDWEFWWALKRLRWARKIQQGEQCGAYWSMPTYRLTQ